MHQNNKQLILLAKASKLPSRILASYMGVSISTYYGYRCESDSRRYSDLPEIRLIALKNQLIERNFLQPATLSIIEGRMKEERKAA